MKTRFNRGRGKFLEGRPVRSTGIGPPRAGGGRPMGLAARRQPRHSLPVHLMMRLLLVFLCLAAAAAAPPSAGRRPRRSAVRRGQAALRPIRPSGGEGAVRLSVPGAVPGFRRPPPAGPRRRFAGGLGPVRARGQAGPHPPAHPAGRFRLCRLAFGPAGGNRCRPRDRVGAENPPACSRPVRPSRPRPGDPLLRRMAGPGAAPPRARERAGHDAPAARRVRGRGRAAGACLAGRGGVLPQSQRAQSRPARAASSN